MLNPPTYEISGPEPGSCAKLSLMGSAREDTVVAFALKHTLFGLGFSLCLISEKA